MVSMNPILAMSMTNSAIILHFFLRFTSQTKAKIFNVSRLGAVEIS